MYAVVTVKGKQYKVAKNDLVKVEKLDNKVGDKITLDVLMSSDDKGNVKVGKAASNVVVNAQVVRQAKEKKIVVFKYKAKKNERKKQGHRQPYSELKITSISDKE